MEWSQALSEKKVLLAQSCLTLCNSMDCSPPGSSVHGIFQAKNTGAGCHFLLQGIFPTQGLNLGLPHCGRVLYHLSPYRGEGAQNMSDPFLSSRFPSFPLGLCVTAQGGKYTPICKTRMTLTYSKHSLVCLILTATP